MEIAGIGRVLFWEGGSLWMALVTGVVEAHSHHAIQLSLPVSGSSQFREEGADWVAYSGAVITPGVVHAFRAPGKVVATILFEPESVAGRSVLSRFPASPIAELGAAEVAALVAPLSAAYFDGADDAVLISLSRHAIAAISDTEVQPPPTDARVVRAIADIRRRLDEPITLPGVARGVGLSAGRFRHLFVSETGVSFRAFVLWERLNKALALGFGGTSWTEAAHAANFADSAHLTRTCRRMFGLAPTGARLERPRASARLSA